MQSLTNGFRRQDKFSLGHIIGFSGACAWHPLQHIASCKAQFKTQCWLRDTVALLSDRVEVNELFVSDGPVGFALLPNASSANKQEDTSATLQGSKVSSGLKTDIVPFAASSCDSSHYLFLNPADGFDTEVLSFIYLFNKWFICGRSFHMTFRFKFGHQNSFGEQLPTFMLRGFYEYSSNIYPFAQTRPWNRIVNKEWWFRLSDVKNISR